MTKEKLYFFTIQRQDSAGSLKIFKKKGLNIKFEKGDRDLIGQVTLKIKNIFVYFKHARESINALANSTLGDIGISGIDLLKTQPSVQKKIKIYKD